MTRCTNSYSCWCLRSFPHGGFLWCLRGGNIFFTSILVNSATLLIIVDFKHETNGNNDIPNFIVVKNTSFQSYLLGKLRIWWCLLRLKVISPLGDQLDLASGYFTRLAIWRITIFKHGKWSLLFHYHLFYGPFPRVIMS